MVESPYISVKEAASVLDITDDGVRKLIRRGSLRAIKQSERKTLIPRPAFDAYLRKINRHAAPPLGRSKPWGSLQQRLDAFKRDVGVAPDAYLAGWLRQDVRTDTHSEMAVAVTAFGLAVEQRSAISPGPARPGHITREDYQTLAGESLAQPTEAPVTDRKLTRR